MNNIKLYISVISILLLYCSCDSNPRYLISGSYSSGDGETIYLREYASPTDSAIYDSVKVVNGKFKFEGYIQSPHKGILTISHQDYPILIEQAPIDVKIDNTAKNGRVKISGSQEQKIFEKINALYIVKKAVAMGEMFAYAKVQNDQGKRDSIKKETNIIKEKIESDIHNLIDSNTNHHSTAYVIADFMIQEYPFDMLLQYYNKLAPNIQSSIAGQYLAKKLEQLQQINTGGLAPDICLCNPEGESIKLSSLKGKYVLIDFWASWCGPCMAEIPNMKEIYAGYHENGLEIYAISLDDNKDNWTNAIKDKDLPWLHVSSLKGWKCPFAQLYHVNSIPQMFLIDPQGKIIAKNLRGKILQEKIASLFTNE